MAELDPIKDFEHVVHSLNAEADKYSKPIRHRYPVLFALLTLFGISAVFYGFELLFSSVPLFVENPSLLVGLGLGVLVITGSLYRMLHKNT